MRASPYTFLALTGLVVFVIGMAVMFLGPGASVDEPSDDPEEKIEFGPGEGSKRVSLRADTYDVWEKEQVLEPDVSTYDSSECLVFSGPKSMKETMTVSGRSYVKYGQFTAQDGKYTVTSEDSVTVYLTGPITMGGAIGGIVGSVCIGLVLIIVGGIIGVIGGILAFTRGVSRGGF